LALDGAQEEDKEMAAAKVLQAQGAVAEVNSYIHETFLTAYADGEVTEIFPHLGELVGTGAPIMNIAQMDDQWASFNVREDYLKDFYIGSEFDAYVPAIDRTVRMKVSYMKDIGDFAAWKATKETGQYDLKTFEVRATPLSATGDLRPGMSVIVKKEHRR
jgi:HlyD family secretion protein